MRKFSFFDPVVAPVVSLAELLSDRRLLLGLLAIGLAAYFPELAFPTSSADYFNNLIASSARINYADGRHLAGLLSAALGDQQPPTFLLILGLALLAASGALFALMLGIRERAPVLLCCALVVVFPFFFEPFAYHAIRLSLPLSMFLAILAVWRPALIWGVILTFMSLSLYQAGVYSAVVATVLLAALRSAQGDTLVQLVRDVIWRRAAAVSLGVIGYAVFRSGTISRLRLQRG